MQTLQQKAAYMRAYRAAHRQETNAAAKRSRLKKHEQAKARDRAYYAAHREECQAKARERYINRRREQMRLRAAAYRETAEFKLAQAQREHAREVTRETARRERKGYRKAHHEKNREHDNAANRAWYAANREKRQAQLKGYNAADPVKTRARNRAWNEANRERQFATQKAWREANRDKVRMYMQKRYALQKGADGEATLADVERMYEEQNGLCFYCDVPLLKRFEVDHYVPLSKGGTNYPENLRLACRRCNRSKGHLTPDEFRKRRGPFALERKL